MSDEQSWGDVEFVMKSGELGMYHELLFFLLFLLPIKLLFYSSSVLAYTLLLQGFLTFLIKHNSSSYLLVGIITGLAWERKSFLYTGWR